MDIAVLGLTVENGQAIRALNAMDVELRRVAESGTAVGDTQRKINADIIRSNGGMERYRAIQRQIADEMRQADVVAQQHAATLKSLETNTAGATTGTNRFRSVLSSLASQAVGTSSSVGQLGGLLGQFAVGGVITSVVLIGITAIAKAYELLSAGAREAKKNVDDLIRSLVAQRQAAFDATLGGAQAQQSAVEVRTSQALERLNDVKSARNSYDPAIRLAAIIRLGKAQKEYDDALTASGQAASNVLQIELDAEKQKEDAKKQAATDAKRHHSEEMQRIHERIALLRSIDAPDISSITDEVSRRPINIPGTFDKNNIPVQSSPAELEKMFRDYHKGQSERRDKALAEEGRALDKSAKAADGHASAMERAAQIVSQSIEYYLVQKLGGGTFGGNVGAAIGKGAAADISGQFGKSAFINSTVGSALFAPIMAGLGAAVGNAVDSIFDFSGAVKALRLEMDKLQKATEQSVAIERVRSSGGDTSQLEGEAAIHERFASLRDAAEKIRAYDSPRINYGPNNAGLARKQIDEAKKAQEEYNAKLAEYKILEDQQIALLKQNIELAKRQFAEDLQVRVLRAQGHDKEADTLALQLQQQREYDAAVKAGADAATLALLIQVQAAEKVKDALGGLQTAVQNAPSGFQLNRYINEFAEGMGGGTSSGWEGRTPFTPKTLGQTITQFSGPVTFTIQGKNGEELLVDLVRVMRKKTDATLGLNAPISQALDLM